MKEINCCLRGWLAPLAVLLALFLPFSAAVLESQAAVGGLTVGGCIYTGHGTVTYTLDAAGEPIGNWSTTFAPDPLTPPISDAQVMLQNQEGGAVIGYGTMGLDTAGLTAGGGGTAPFNCWEATIPSGDGITPAATDLVVMFSAPGHDLTSREFTWNAALGEFTHPKQGGGIAMQVDTAAGGLATGPQDAYLVKLNVAPGTGATTQATANLLHYVFYDNFTNGGDNGPVIDPGLNGVTVTVSDAAGNTWTQKTGELAFSQNGFVTKDGLPFLGSMAYGFVYFTGLPGGQAYEVTSDPSTVTQADNPHITLDANLNHSGTAGRCSLDRTVGPYGYGDLNTATCPWYQTSTEEGGHSWDVFLWPGDPGTEMGFYLTWHAYIEKLGSDGGAPNPLLAGSISGMLLDADGNDPEEPFPQTGGGRVPPTNARFEDGTPWDVNLNSAGWGGCLTQPGNICPPLGRDYIPNGRVADAIVALYSTGGGVPKLIATAEATQPTLYNSADGGEWAFTNVPPGQYEIFTFDKDLVNVPTVGTALNIVPGVNTPISIMNPRFKARGAGFVMNNGAPVDATVKVQYLGGATQNQVNTNPATGWFEVYNLPETGGLGKFYVDLQDGDSIRGKIISEDFQREVPAAVTNVTHNAMSRSAQWWTLNYFIDLQVEDIPVGVGNLIGVVFADTLATGGWAADGLWQEELETANGGETVELYATTIDPVTGLAVCPDLATSPPVAATAMTGLTNGADAAIMGWVPFGTWPPNEIGGVFGDPVVCDTGNLLDNRSQTTGTPAPANGFYEFRDLAPGSYCVRVAPQAGFRNSPDLNDGMTLVTVAAGLNSRIDLGVTSTPTAPLGGPLGDGVGACNAADPLLPLELTCDNNRAVTCSVATESVDCANLPSPLGSIPMAGLIEGGVFSGNGDLDPNPLSTMFDEAMNIVGSPVGVYDQYNYLLGVMYQTDAWCNLANNAVHVPGSYPADPFACSSATDILQPPEMDRYFAPGMYRYAGNDANFTKDPTIALPDATGIVFGGNDKTRGFDPRFETMELGAGMTQGGFLLEFAWTPLTPIDGSVAADMCAIGVTGTTFNSEPYGGNVTITVSDGFTPIIGAEVSGSVAGKGGEPCFTNAAGICTISFEKFEGAGTSVVFTVDNIVSADPWYVYNPTPGGTLAGACQTSLTLYEPGFVPPPGPDPACSDGADNDGDGLVDFPADPGCFSAVDNDEADAPLPTYQCSDGLDNDGDGLIDFGAGPTNDPGCFSAIDQDETDIPPEPVFACSDGVDNDLDGLIDMADPGCDTVTDNDETDPVTLCTDGIDNDGDTLIDLADPGCISAMDNDEYNAPLPVCSDFLDNDGDGLIDFPADPGCLSTTDTDESDVVYLCSDGIDNDLDGLIDFPADPGCTSAIDQDEADPLVACNNGLDDDLDTLVDMADPGCSSPTDTDEYNAPLPVCSDFLDNDGDGLIDFPADPGCLSSTDTDETDVVYACSDGIDNDGDTLIDFPADPGCISALDLDETDPVTQCNDGIDNDADTLIDMADPGCSSALDDNEFNAPLAQCADGLDNDLDGLIDYPADPGCLSSTDLDETDPLPACSDLVDNDGDGLIDLADPGCTDALDTDEFNAPLPQCSDGIDNDADGLIDFPADQGCTSATDTDELNACTDGIDNDGDGLIDFPADQGCVSLQDTDEFDAPMACADGLDNDGDGKIDLLDPGCSSFADNDETDPVTACNDGLDNDGDTLIDFPADPGCMSLQDIDEFNAPLAQCADGIDNDGDGFIDLADLGCSNAADNDETDPVFACSDGLDNDGDGFIDLLDPGCADATDNDEFNAPLAQCTDGIDNDGDGLIDFPVDLGCSSVTDNDETDVATSVHAASLSGVAGYKDGKLYADVTVGIVDDIGNPVDGAVVSMIFTRSKEGRPTSKLFGCTTDVSGSCTARTKEMEKTSSVAISLDTVSAALTYRPQDNTVSSITVP